MKYIAAFTPGDDRREDPETFGNTPPSAGQYVNYPPFINLTYNPDKDLPVLVSVRQRDFPVVVEAERYGSLQKGDTYFDAGPYAIMSISVDDLRALHTEIGTFLAEQTTAERNKRHAAIHNDIAKTG